MKNEFKGTPEQSARDTELAPSELKSIERYRRATNYLAAAQIYLKENPLLEEPLRPEHIKVRAQDRRSWRLHQA